MAELRTAIHSSHERDWSDTTPMPELCEPKSFPKARKLVDNDDDDETEVFLAMAYSRIPLPHLLGVRRRKVATQPNPMIKNNSWPILASWTIR